MKKDKMKRAVTVYHTFVLKAFRTRPPSSTAPPSPPPPPPRPPHQTITTTSLVGPPFLTRTLMAKSKNISPPFPSSSCGTPCLDLFFHVRSPPFSRSTPSPLYSPEYLKQLLPLAWSHNPLTTLKLICNLLPGLHERPSNGKDDREGFYTAAYWLYQNHPNTLACNLPLIASMGTLRDLLELLYRILLGEDVRIRQKSTERLSKYPVYPTYQDMWKGIGGRTCSRMRREKIFAMANKALDRYCLDPNYRLLHDVVSDLYADCLKSDIQHLNNYHTNNDHADDDHNDDGGGHEESEYLVITDAAYICPNMDSSYDRATLLCENIAKKVFPRELEEEPEEAYAYRVRKQLRNDVLVPLRKTFEPAGWNGRNRWGYVPTRFQKEPCPVQTYLEEVKSGKSEIKATALLPCEIIGFLMDKYNKLNNNDAGLVAAAELQWKTMVEDIYLKQRKFKNCLAVCDVCNGSGWAEDVSVALGILMSQLSEEPWNGKVITYTQNPRLLSIQGRDLKSKYSFMSTMDDEVLEPTLDFQKVLDLILQVAVNGKLKPEEMIKRVFVFTEHGFNNKWEGSDYEAIHTKYKEKGFGDVVPQVVLCNLRSYSNGSELPCTQPGMTRLTFFIHNNFVKSFLDNDGDIGPHHLMEAAIAGEVYENLVVLD